MTKPTEAEGKPSLFDRFASLVEKFVSKAWFFALCVLLVVVWAPSFPLFQVDTWQLIINTATTIVTFLLVALLQNTQKRGGDAIQHKLNAIADGLADLIENIGSQSSNSDAKELRAAVGLEDRENTR